MENLLSTLVQISNAERFAEIEKRTAGGPFVGDFSGSVTGHWVRLGDMAEGIVMYNDKEYTTKPIGLTSIPAGTAVELTFASGTYYSKF